MQCWRFRDPRQCTWKLRVSPGKLRLEHPMFAKSRAQFCNLTQRSRDSEGSLSADDSSPATRLGVQAGPQSLGGKRYFRQKVVLRAHTLTRSEDGDLVASPGLLGGATWKLAI